MALGAIGALFGGVAGCGSSSSSSSTASSSTPASTTAATDTTAAATDKNKDVKIAVLSTGAVNNRSWANSWADGAKKAAAETGATITMVGNVETPDQYTQQGASFASKGYNLIVFAHGAMNESAIKLAKQFPDVQFVQAPYEFAKPADQAAEPVNLGHVDFKQEQGSFLSGALAGMVTKSNKVAAVYAFPFPALTRQPEAFSLGARCVNPSVQFVQKATNSFTDSALARAAASSLYSAGNDVIFSAVDQAVQGVVAAANSAATKPVYVVASYSEQHDIGPDVVLTSVLYNLGGGLENIVKAYLADELGKNWYASYDLKDGVGELGTLANGLTLTAAQQKNMDDIKAAILSGDIKVPDGVTGTNPIGLKVGAGAAIDPASLGCTPAMQVK